MRLLFIFLFGIGSITCFAQQLIPVNYNKNVHIVFSYDILTGDCSSNDIIISHSQNILKIGVVEPFKEDKSITILTDNKLLFTFIVRYQDDIDQLAYVIPDSQGIKIPYQKTNNELSIKSSDLGTDYKLPYLNSLCSQVYSEKNYLNEIGNSYKKIVVELAGIWVKDGLLFFKLILANQSNIPYEISSSNLSIAEKTTLKKSSSAPVKRESFYVFNEFETIPSKSKNNIYIMVFESFTIGHDKKLILELVEHNGARKVEFEVLQDLIIRAPFIE